MNLWSVMRGPPGSMVNTVGIPLLDELVVPLGQPVVTVTATVAALDHTTGAYTGPDPPNS